MPIASICLDCNRLFTPQPATATLGRCEKCRAAYTERRASQKRGTKRTPHRQTPKRQELQRFYSSTQWRRVRDQVRKRDGACTTCGTTEHLTVHHLVSISTDPTLALDPDNLATLCRSCHAKTSNTTRARTRTRSVVEESNQ
jgi:5-methylcytosine-specific restriction endonuclease McrA